MPPINPDWNGSKIRDASRGSIPTARVADRDRAAKPHPRRRPPTSVPPVGHRAQRVVAQIPEHLLHRVAIRARAQRAGRRSCGRSCYFPWAMASRSIKSSVSSISATTSQSRERVRFLARIIQKVGNDLIQPLRFPADDLDQFLVVVFERRKARQAL